MRRSRPWGRGPGRAAGATDGGSVEGQLGPGEGGSGRDGPRDHAALWPGSQGPGSEGPVEPAFDTFHPEREQPEHDGHREGDPEHLDHFVRHPSGAGPRPTRVLVTSMDARPGRLVRGARQVDPNEARRGPEGRVRRRIPALAGWAWEWSGSRRVGAAGAGCS